MTDPSSETADTNEEFDTTLIRCSDRTSQVLPRDRVAAARNQMTSGMLQILQAVASSNEIVELNRQWSACMASRGFSFATPSEASIAAFRSDGPVPLPSAATVSQAHADYSCQRDVHLQEQVTASRQTPIERWVDENTGVLIEMNAAQDAIVEAAKAVLKAA